MRYNHSLVTKHLYMSFVLIIDMGDTKKLLEQTREYLNQYLTLFIKKGKLEDKQFLPQRPEDEYLNISPNVYDRIERGNLPQSDFHKLKFNTFYDNINSTNQSELIKFVSSLKDPIVIDVGGTIGNDFAVPIAKQNKKAHMLVYNPLEETENSSALLEEIAKRMTDNYFSLNFDKRVPQLNFDEIDVQINTHYRNLNIHENIMFMREFLGKEDIGWYAKKFPNRQIIIYSNRTPATPKDMTHEIAEAVNEFDNVEMILRPPLVNKITAYKNDPIIELIQKGIKCFKTETWKRIYGPPGKHMAVNPSEHPESRLYSAMNLYYALKSAEIAGGIVLKEKDLMPGAPVFHTLFYSTTINPNK